MIEQHGHFEDERGGLKILHSLVVKNLALGKQDSNAGLRLLGKIQSLFQKGGRYTGRQTIGQRYPRREAKRQDPTNRQGSKTSKL